MTRMTRISRVVLCGLMIVGVCVAEPAVHDGESIAFMGDSITQQGAGTPSGYVRLVISGLEANGLKVTPYPAGISGHKSNQMLDRLEAHVISKKPTWMTLSCGVNDVWHGARGVPLDEYKVNISQIVERAQAAGIKVMILTATMIKEDKTNSANLKLDEYNALLRELASEKKCALADLNQDMKDAVEALGGFNPKQNHLTTDGVHMDVAGNIMMAKGILRAFGLDDEMLAKAEAYWLAIPEACSLRLHSSKLPRVSIARKRELDRLAAEKGVSLETMLADALRTYVDSL